MTTPTEAEIREAIAEPVREALGNIMQMLANALDPITDSDVALTRRGWADGFSPQADHPGTLWADLTAEEAAELQAAILPTTDLDRLAEAITETVVAAAVAFAEAHPDIPRGTYGKPQLIPA